jgi:hypothetical protein
MKSRRRIVSPKAQNLPTVTCNKDYSRDLRPAKRGLGFSLQGSNPEPLGRVMSALCQKQTLRRVLDMIESVGKVLKLFEHHHEISP